MCFKRIKKRMLDNKDNFSPVVPGDVDILYKPIKVELNIIRLVTGSLDLVFSSKRHDCPLSLQGVASHIMPLPNFLKEIIQHLVE